MTVQNKLRPLAQRIPLADPRRDLSHIRADILAAVARVVDSGSYVLGPEVAELERKMAASTGAAGAVGVASGTDALVLALLASGVSPGDEVITVSHTAGPTAAAISMIGAVPVLIDIEPETYCLDPVMLEAAIGPRTRAIVPVHLYGCPADLSQICAIAEKHDISVIEDCAHAQGASIGGRSVGSIGAAGCFSFYPTKNLGAIGDGGSITSSRIEIVERARVLRTYGWSKPQFSQFPNGRCSRLDEMQAAILNVKISHLPADVEKRRCIAHYYNNAFTGLPLYVPVEPAASRHVFHLYVVRCDSRDELANHLERAGIMSGIHYRYPVHVQPGIAGVARIPLPLKITETVVGEILTLPLYPSMTAEYRDRVVEGVRSFFGNN